MAQKFAGNFYKTSAWINCRNSYAKSVGNLCEKCLEKNVIKAGEIVHHKIFLNKNNIENPEITLSWKNLQLLCRDCHAKIHSDNPEKRYRVGDDGEVIVE